MVLKRNMSGMESTLWAGILVTSVWQQDLPTIRALFGDDFDLSEVIERLTRIRNDFDKTIRRLQLARDLSPFRRQIIRLPRKPTGAK